MKEIETEQDIELLVHSFYDKVRADKILFPVFDEIIQDNWPAHLEKMVRFWSTLLLYTRNYDGDPLTKHIPLPLTYVHFERWLGLFGETVDAHYIGIIAENAKKRANSIAKIMKAVKDIKA